MITVSSWRETLKEYLYLKNRALVEKDISWIQDLIIESNRNQYITLFSYLYEQQRERKAYPLVSTSDIKHMEIAVENGERVEIVVLIHEGTLYKIENETYKQEIEVKRRISLVSHNNRWLIEQDEQVPYVLNEGKETDQRYVYNRLEAVRYGGMILIPNFRGLRMIARILFLNAFLQGEFLWNFLRVAVMVGGTGELRMGGVIVGRLPIVLSCI